MREPDTCPECGCILVDPKEHSDQARKRFFAIMRDAYENMPDHWRPLIASDTHLRKYVLCRVGHCDITTTDCGSKAAAERVAVLAKHLDTFAVVEVRDTVVTTMIAKSLRKRVCPKKVFMPLTEKAYAYLNSMFGYDVEQSEFGEAA